MQDYLKKAREFTNIAAYGEDTEEQGIEALKGLAPHLDKIKDLEGKDLAVVIDVLVSSGERMKERLLAGVNKGNDLDNFTLDDEELGGVKFD